MVYLLAGLLFFTNYCWYIFFVSYRNTVKRELKKLTGQIINIKLGE